MLPSWLTRRQFYHATRLHVRPAARLSAGLLKTFAVAHMFMDMLWFAVPARGPSMLPTLEVEGDCLLINKRYGKGKGIKVGDIISFKAVNEPGAVFLKRVIGLPGDYVMRNTPGSKNTEMLQVPKGHCWVVGDNMNYSNDSRMFGPLPMALIIGKITGKILPFSERRWIEDGLMPV